MVETLETTTENPAIIIHPKNNKILLIHFSGLFPSSCRGNLRSGGCINLNPDMFVDDKLNEKIYKGAYLAMIMIDRQLRKTYGNEKDAIKAIDDAWRQAYIPIKGKAQRGDVMTYSNCINYTLSDKVDDYMSMYNLAEPFHNQLHETKKFNFPN